MSMQKWKFSALNEKAEQIYIGDIDDFFIGTADDAELEALKRATLWEFSTGKEIRFVKCEPYGVITI